MPGRTDGSWKGRKESLFAIGMIVLMLILVGCTSKQIPSATQPAEAASESVATSLPVNEQETEFAPDSTTAPTDVLPAAPDTDATVPATDTAAPVPAESRLETVKKRGRLICGVNGDLPGFGYLENGQYKGFDTDFCRVVAAAIFGDPDAVQFRLLNAEERFPAVQNGEVDVLFRNTTWTATVDTQLHLDVGPTTFHDGQGFMARRTLNITGLDGLAGKSICVLAGTTSEANLQDQFTALSLSFTPVTQPEAAALYSAYDTGQCDAITSDRSQLVAMRTKLQNPDEHGVLDTLISREPLGPVIQEDDSTWRDIVSWSVYATIYAEELNVTSQNVDLLLTNRNPNIQMLLGIKGTIGQDLGLGNDFALNIIRRVGNYEEIYNRNLGPDTPFNLDRGPNKAWNKGQGGVLSSPPFR